MGIPAIDKALGLPVDVADHTPARSGALATCLPCTSVFEFFLLFYMLLARMWLAMVASILSFVAPCFGCCGNLTVGGLRTIIYVMVVAAVLRVLEFVVSVARLAAMDGTETDCLADCPRQCYAKRGYDGTADDPYLCHDDVFKCGVTCVDVNALTFNNVTMVSKLYCAKDGLITPEGGKQSDEEIAGKKIDFFAFVSSNACSRFYDEAYESHKNGFVGLFVVGMIFILITFCSNCFVLSSVRRSMEEAQKNPITGVPAAVHPSPPIQLQVLAPQAPFAQAPLQATVLYPGAPAGVVVGATPGQPQPLQATVLLQAVPVQPQFQPQFQP